VAPNRRASRYSAAGRYEGTDCSVLSKGWVVESGRGIARTVRAVWAEVYQGAPFSCVTVGVGAFVIAVAAEPSAGTAWNSRCSTGVAVDPVACDHGQQAFLLRPALPGGHPLGNLAVCVPGDRVTHLLFPCCAKGCTGLPLLCSPGGTASERQAGAPKYGICTRLFIGRAGCRP
jgi:hypothetical protein